MAELADFKCKQCDEMFPRAELELNDGYCDTCAAGRCIICREPLTEEEMNDDRVDHVKCTEAIENAEETDDSDLSDELRRAKRAYEKHAEYMKTYNQKPAVKAKRSQYNKDRRKKDNLLIQRLRAMGQLPQGRNGKNDEERD